MKKTIFMSIIIMIFFTSNIYADQTLDDIRKEHFIDMNRKMNTVRIMAVGDLMMHMPIVNAAKVGTDYDFEPIFTRMKDTFTGSDYLIGNLETTLTDETESYSGYPRFKSPTSLVTGLKRAGFDILTTANNHALDAGTTGLNTTLNTLDEAGILHTGTFLDDDQRILTVQHRDIQLGIVAYTYGTNGLIPEKPGMVNYIDYESMQADLDAMEEAGADIKIISIHWGTEYHDDPNAYQKDLLKKLQDMGYDVILGSHPHVVQEMDYGENSIGIYSLGNFLSNQRDGHKDLGAVLDLTIEVTENGLEFRRIEIIPTWVDKYEAGMIDYKVKRIDSLQWIETSEHAHINKLMSHFNSIYQREILYE
jgi:poly-gamma-glutamate synthesis protein (capsule biosynthesis protein)